MLTITHAILHIFDGASNEPLLSHVELDKRSPYIHDYIKKKCEKITQTDRMKEGVLTDDSPVKALFDAIQDDFIPISQELSLMLSEMIKSNADIPNADLLWACIRGEDHSPYLAMFKLNHQEAMTHHVDYEDQNLKNDLIINQAILPGIKQGIDEGFLYQLDNGRIQILEKKHLIDESGDREFYLSELFLGQAIKASLKENIGIVKKAVSATAKKYAEADYAQLAQVKEVLNQSIVDQDTIDNEAIAESLYRDNPAQKADYLAASSQAGLQNDEKIVADPALMTNRMQKQKLKLDNGIELSIPIELFNDPNSVEIQNNPDGTVSVWLKNIDEIKNMF